VPEIIHGGLPQPVKLESCHMTFKVLVCFKTKTKTNKQTHNASGDAKS
jgi:hypothetical protein